MCWCSPACSGGALDARASKITENMKVAAAYAIAGIMGAGEMDAGHILPSIFDERVRPTVSAAVMEAAKKDGVSRLEYEKVDKVLRCHSNAAVDNRNHPSTGFGL